jgi:hypothetical protein
LGGSELSGLLSGFSRISFAGLVTVAVIGLKAGHEITWPWWLVLSPLWVTAVLVVAGLLLPAAIAAARR